MQATKLSSIGVPVTHFDSHLEIMKMEQQTILMVCWTGAFQWLTTFQARVSKGFKKHSQVDLFFLTLPRDCGYLIPTEGAFGSVKGKLLWRLMQFVRLKMDNLICHLNEVVIYWFLLYTFENTYRKSQCRHSVEIFNGQFDLWSYKCAFCYVTPFSLVPIHYRLTTNASIHVHFIKWQLFFDFSVTVNFCVTISLTWPCTDSNKRNRLGNSVLPFNTITVKWTNISVCKYLQKAFVFICRNITHL